MNRSILTMLVLSCACSTTEPRTDVQLSTGSATPTPGLARVSIRLTVADMPRARADQLFGAVDPNGSEFGPEFTRELDALARAGAGVEIEQRPSLLLLDEHRGNIDIGSPESYVQDFKIDKERGIADPIVATLWEGLRFEAQPAIRPDGAAVDLDFRIEVTTLERPIPESTVELPDLGSPVTVQMPSTTMLAESRRITLPPGRVYAFVLHPESDERDSGRVKLVTLEIGLSPGEFASPDGAKDTVHIESSESQPH